MLFGIRVGIVIEQILADQVLDHDSRLGKLNFAALLEIQIGSAGLQTDVLAAKKSGRQMLASESSGIWSKRLSI